MLDAEQYKSLIKNAPLFSLDLIVLNPMNEILIGRRTNAPAKNWWFVPGGRVQKNETLQSACLRISKSELGFELELSESYFLGIYEHFYKDCFFCNDISTHYINASYMVRLNLDSMVDIPYEQHDEYRWVPLECFSADEKVHKYSKVFLQDLGSLLLNLGKANND